MGEGRKPTLVEVGERHHIAVGQRWHVLLSHGPRVEKTATDEADVDKARSSKRYDSVNWWRLNVHDLGFKPKLIRTPATVIPLLRWLSTTRTRLTSPRRLSCKQIENTSKNGMNAI